METNLQSIASDIAEIKSAILHTKKVLTFKEACAYTGLSESYMYKLTSANIVPFSKPNNKTIYFSKEALDEWLLSGHCKSSQAREVAAATYVATH